MVQLSVASTLTAPSQPTLSLGEQSHHARIGNAVHKWVNDVTPGATEVVLVNPSLVYNIPADSQVMITRLYIGLLTPSDNVHANLVGCSAVDGGGTATDLCGHEHIYSSGNLAGTENAAHEFRPPIRVRNTDYASISVRVDCNDATAEMSASWCGFVETETPD